LAVRATIDTLWKAGADEKKEPCCMTMDEFNDQIEQVIDDARQAGLSDDDMLGVLQEIVAELRDGITRA
jgi:DNA-binding transcriptional regulator YhcF (GntR family)